MLTKQLKELAAGIINRSVFPEVPTRVEYNLTELGNKIHHILIEMYRGGKLFSQIINSDD